MKLIYIYDALCGWCYGFSPVIHEFVATYKLDCHVLSGGMITGNRVGPVGDVAPYIKQAHKDVEQRSSVKFGKDFLEGTLEKGSAVFTSVPAAIAMAVFKKVMPKHQLDYASEIQRAIYYHGKQPAEHATFAQIVTKYGIEPHSFQELMEQTSYFDQAREEFESVSRLGISGFPTVLLQSGVQSIAISRGFLPFQELQTNYERALTLV
ncbi:MAG: DsbA family protein [Nonlabens sp.]